MLNQVVRNKSLSFVPVLHTRKIEHNAPVFFLEASSCDKRKELLRQEIKRLKNQLDSMEEWSDFADKINVKRQQDRMHRQEAVVARNDSTSELTNQITKTSTEEKRENKKPSFKNRMLVSVSSHVAADSDKVGQMKEKRKYVRKDNSDAADDSNSGSAVADDSVVVAGGGGGGGAGGGGVSRGKAQKLEAVSSNK